MKQLAAILVAVLVVCGGALVWIARPEPLTVPPDFAFELPEPRPPDALRLSVLHTGKMFSRAALAYRGGALLEPRVFGMAAILVQHPQGWLLFDAGFGRDVDQHVQTTPLLMRATSSYAKEAPVADQLAARHLSPDRLKAVVLTHAHWDHVSGLQDLGPVPVWVTAPELAFIRSQDPGTALARSFGDVDWSVYEFAPTPYLGFAASHDVFGDGSVVLVPAPGHTPGSIIAFIHLPSGAQYALIGDLAWQREGIALPAERPWVSQHLVDVAPEDVRRLLVHMHQLQSALPSMTVVPAHDRRVLESLPAFPASAS